MRKEYLLLVEETNRKLRLMEDFKKSFDKIDTVFDKLKGLDAKVNDASPLKKFALLQKAGKMDLGKFTKAVSKKADALKNAKKSKKRG